MRPTIGIRRRMLPVVTSLALCVAVGTIGYRLIEGWPWLDALYMTVITIGTVGFGETHPLGSVGRVFTMFLIFGGFGLVTYGFTTLTAIIVEGDLNQVFRRNRMERKIARMHGHYIVCGAGHTGAVICDELRKTGRHFVVIDHDGAALLQLEEHLGQEVLCVVGDASDDAVLIRAGVSRAAGVFAVLSTDQDNAFVALSSKGINPAARVLTCQRSFGVREKLLRSGADGVVDPEFIGGMRLASEMIRPVTVSFLDAMLRETAAHFRFDEINVPADSPLLGHPLGAIKGAAGGGPLIVAVVAAGTETQEINPSVERLLGAGDRLIVLGETGALGLLRRQLGA